MAIHVRCVQIIYLLQSCLWRTFIIYRDKTYCVLSIALHVASNDAESFRRLETQSLRTRVAAWVCTDSLFRSIKILRHAFCKWVFYFLFYFFWIEWHATMYHCWQRMKYGKIVPSNWFWSQYLREWTLHYWVHNFDIRIRTENRSNSIRVHTFTPPKFGLPEFIVFIFADFMLTQIVW